MISLLCCEYFKNNIDTLKGTSLDSSHNVYMSNSSIKVINFDNVKKQYSSDNHFPCEVHSVDAIAKTEDRLLFIEFKNGSKFESNLRLKALESMFIFYDIVKETLDFSKNNVELVLVYNETKAPTNLLFKQHEFKKSGKKYIGFDIDNYYQLLYKDANSFSETEFNEYVNNLIDIDK